MSEEKSSAAVTPHRWSYDMRRWVVIGLVGAAALFAYFIRETIPVLVLAILVAYLLNPVVTLLAQGLRMRRWAACALVYLVFIGVLIAAAVLLVPNVVRQVSTIVSDFDMLVARVLEVLQRVPFVANWIGGIDARELSAQLKQEATEQAEQLPRFLAGASSSAFNIGVVLVLSFYFLKDADTFTGRIATAVPEAYRADFERITGDVDRVWSGFLRGQVLLSIIIGTMTTLALMVLGVRNALLLGILAGVLEVVPTIGPVLAMIPAVAIAFFQGSTHWAIDPVLFAAIVILTYFVIQQLENQLIVPNVLGASVDLPPVVILIGTLIGASLAGVVGIFLAAPVIATARLFFRYVRHKLFEPLPEDGTGSKGISEQNL